MPYYDRIDVFEGIDVNKTSQCKEYDICHCLEFLHKRFKFQPCTCSGYHDVLMTSMNLSNIVISWFKRKMSSIINYKNYI